MPPLRSHAAVFLLLAATLLVAGITIVSRTIAAAAASRGTWHTPSRNIVCRPWWFYGYVNCVVLSETTRRGQRHFYVRYKGRARSYFARTHWKPTGHVLEYGEFWISGHGTYVKCRSRRKGLTCRNFAGHGFFLSRQRQRLF